MTIKALVDIYGEDAWHFGHKQILILKKDQVAEILSVDSENVILKNPFQAIKISNMPFVKIIE